MKRDATEPGEIDLTKRGPALYVTPVERAGDWSTTGGKLQDELNRLSAENCRILTVVPEADRDGTKRYWVIAEQMPFR